MLRPPSTTFPHLNVFAKAVCVSEVCGGYNILVLCSRSLTCEVDFGLAADEQAVTVLCSAVVLAHVCIAALSAFLEALY